MKLLTIEYTNGETKSYKNAHVKAVPYDAVYFKFECESKTYYVYISNIKAIIVEEI